MIKYMAVAVSGGGAVGVAVPVTGLTKRFLNHIQKDFLINVWGYPNYPYRGTLITRTERDPNYPYQWYDY